MDNDDIFPWEIGGKTKVIDISDISIGDETVKKLILEQNNPLAIQDELRALFSYEEKKDVPYPISARELHRLFGIRKDLNAWIKNMIRKYDFKEDEDYTTCFPNLASGSNDSQNEYCLTIDTAKEIALIQRNDLGKLVRRYLIWAKKKLHEGQVTNTPRQSRLPLDILEQMVQTFRAQQEQIRSVQEVQTAQQTILDNYGERLRYLEGPRLRPTYPIKHRVRRLNGIMFQMHSDGMSWEYIKNIVKTALADHGIDLEERLQKYRDELNSYYQFRVSIDGYGKVPREILRPGEINKLGWVSFVSTDQTIYDIVIFVLEGSDAS